MSNGGSIKYSVGFSVDKTGLNEIKASLQQLQQMSEQDLIKMNPAMAHNVKAELQKIKTSAKEVETAFSKAFNSNLGTLNVSKLNQELKKLDIKKIEADFAKMGTAGSTAFRNLATQAMTTNTHLKQSHSLLNKMGKTLANTIKWNAASSVMNGFTRGIHQAYGYVKNLDRSLNDIRIVTGLSADEMDKFAQKANKAAQSLGQTTTNYTDAALIYYQQGLAGKEVEQRAETTLKAANVTGQTGEEVSEQLTAVWNGYKVAAEETELYIDKLAAVAATTASDLEELSTGMSKVASAANVAGVDIDQLNATLSTVISVTRQAPETVGTAFKTIYARMGDLAVDGVDEFGTTLGSVSSKMKTMGIAVTDESGNLREMGTIVEEVAAKWDTWTEGQKQAAAVAMAGKRQYNNLIALFDNWDMYEESLLTSANAAGTLQRQQDTYMESTQAHLKSLKASAENLYDSILDPKAINTVADGLAAVANAGAGFVDAIGGGIPLLMTLGSIGMKVFSQQLATGIATFITNLQISRENIRHLQAEAQIVQQFGGKVTDPKTQALIGMKEQILALDKSITNEERNQANTMIQQQNTLTTQAEQLQNQLKTAEQLHQKLTGATYNSQTSTGRQAMLNGLVREQADFASLQKGAAEANKIYSQFRVMSTAGGDRNQSDAAKNYRASLQHQLASTKELLSMDKLAVAEKEKLIAAYEKFNQIAKKGTGINLKSSKVVAAARGFEEAYQAAIKSTTDKLTESIGALRNHEAALKANDAALKQNTQAFNTFIKGLNFRAAIQQSINFVSSIGQVAMALNSIRGLGSIIRNDDISAGEKALQILTTLGFTIPMLASGLSGMKAAIAESATAMALFSAIQSAFTVQSIAVTGANDAITASYARRSAVERVMQVLTKKGIATNLAEAAANLIVAGSEDQKAIAKSIMRAVTKKKMSVEAAEIVLNEMLAGSNIQVAGSAHMAAMAMKEFYFSLPVVGQVILALTALAAIIGGIALGLTALHNTEERAVKKASKNVDELNKHFEETKQLVDDVKSNLDGWKSAQDTLKGLTRGTAEWKQALLEANSYVLELLSTYPELAKYITTDNDGLMQISQQGLDYINETNATRLENAQRSQMAGEVAYTQAQNDLLMSGKDDSFTDASWSEQKVIAKAMEYAQANGIEFLSENAGQLLGRGFSPGDAAVIREYADEIAAATTKVAANNVAMEAYTDQIVQTGLAEDEHYQNLSESDKALVGQEYSKEYQLAYDKAYKELNTKSEIRQAHMEDIGATEVRKSDNKGYSEYKIGDEWVEISDEAARVAAASTDAATGLEGFTSDLYLAGEGLLWFRDQLIGNNSTDVTNKEGEVTRYAMSENEANAIAGYHKGDEFLNTEGMTDAELYNLVVATNGKGNNDYKFTTSQAEAAGYEASEEGVKQMTNDLWKLAKAEWDARKQEDENRATDGKNAVKAGMEASGKFTGRAGADRRNQLDQPDTDEDVYGDVYNSTQGVRNEKTGKVIETGWDWDAVLPEGVNPEDIINQIDWSQAPDDPEGFQQWYKDQAAQGISEAQLDSKITAEGLNVEEVDAYAAHLQEIADTHDGIADTLDEDPLAAKKIAANSKIAAAGMEAFTKTIETYGDVLEEGNTASEKWTAAASAVRDNMGDILSLSEEDMGWMTDDYIANNFEEIKKAAEGDVEAIQALWAEAGQQHLIDIDLDIPQDQFNEMSGLINQIADEDLEIGATIDQSQYAMALFNMMTAANATAEEIQGQFNRIGWEPETETRTITLTKADKRKGHVTVPSQIAVGEDGEIEIAHQELPIDSSLQVGDTFTYTVIKGTGNKKNFTPNMTRKTTAAIGGGAGSGSGGGGGGGGSKPKKTYKRTEKKKDRYYKVNNELKELTTQLERLQTAQEHLFGDKLLKNLNDQLKVLQKQAQVTKEKLKIAKAEAAEMRKSIKNQEPGVYNDLLDFGIQFNEDGTIKNYNKIMTEWDDKIKKMHDYWNSKSAAWQESEAGKAYEEKIKKAEENRDTLQELVEEYGTIIYEKIPGLIDEVTQNAYDQIAIRFEAFHIEADLKLDLTDAYNDWAEFQEELAEFEFPDDLAAATQPLVDAIDYINNAGLGDEYAGNLETFAKLWEAYDNGDFSDTTFLATNPDGTLMRDADGNVIFDEKTFSEKSREEMQAAMDYILEQEERIRQVHENYIESIERVGEAYDEELEVLEYIGDQLEHNLNMIQLMKGETAYEDMAAYYEERKNNLADTLSKQQESISYYKQQMDEATDEEAKETWRKLYLEALATYEETLEATAEVIQAEFENAVLLQLEEFDKALGSAQFGTRIIKTKWEIDTQNAEKYLDVVEKTYGLQTLTNKINKSISETDSISAQKRLNGLLNDELKKLREKDKLTQYDLDRANAMYELELKKIALEEAQNNKAQMRLRRDASGNYSYQFVADQESIADAEQEMLDAQNNLYSMDKEELQNRQAELWDTYQEYQDLMVEYSQLSAAEREKYEDEYALKFANLQQRMVDLGAECSDIQVNLAESASMAMTAAYDLMGEEMNYTLDEIVPAWASGMDEMIDKINGPDNSFRTAMENMFQSVIQASDAAAAEMATLGQASALAMKEAEAAAQDWKTAAEATTATEKEQAKTLKDLNTKAQAYKQTWEGIKNRLKQALSTMQNILTTQLKLNAAQTSSSNTTSTTTSTTTTQNSGNNNNNDNTESVNDAGGSGGGGGGGGGGLPPDGGSTPSTTPTLWQRVTNWVSGWGTRGHRGVGSYDTGGYTGDWHSDEGRLAILHQKELVLNAKDTENILKTVQLLNDQHVWQTVANAMYEAKPQRTDEVQLQTQLSGIQNLQLDRMIENLSTQLVQGINRLAISLEPVGTSIKDLTNEKKSDIINIGINADFPNANSAKEIEQAFMQLTNIATQRAYSNKR